MKNLLIKLAAWLVLSFIIYLLFCFAFWKMNPKFWEEWARVLFSIFEIVFLAYAITENWTHEVMKEIKEIKDKQ